MEGISNMPKLHEPTSGTDAEIDTGTSLKQMPTSPAYEHLMHKSHPAYKAGGAGFVSCGTGVCMTTFSGGSEKTGPETPAHKRTSSNLNKVMK